MKYRTLITICLISSIVGSLLFAYFNGIIILRNPWNNKQQIANHHTINQKKECIFHYWNNEKWNQEKIELVWSDNQESSLLYLLNNWFTYLEEEHLIHKKITVQTALLSSNGYELYLSFDRNPLNQEQSIYEKLLFLHGLLTTIHVNCSDITSVIFLVDHQPLHDIHLDFSSPWPTTGFLTT